MAVPKEYGGTNYDSISQALVFEAWGYGCVGFGTTLAASCLSADSLLVAGTPEQKKLFFGALVKGGLGAFALTEPGAGSDAGSGTTTAKKVGNEYVLNGTKCFISNGGYAKVFVVFAITDPSKGLKGISAFVVEREREGLVLGRLSTSWVSVVRTTWSSFYFSNLKIPETHLLGKEGDGMKIAMKPGLGASSGRSACGRGCAERSTNASNSSETSTAVERRSQGRPLNSGLPTWRYRSRRRGNSASTHSGAEIPACHSQKNRRLQRHFAPTPA